MLHIASHQLIISGNQIHVCTHSEAYIVLRLWHWQYSNKPHHSELPGNYSYHDGTAYYWHTERMLQTITFWAPA